MHFKFTTLHDINSEKQDLRGGGGEVFLNICVCHLRHVLEVHLVLILAILGLGVIETVCILYILN